MIRRRINSRRTGEQGVVIILVAVVLLFVVGAMAALAIDLVSFYTARSEAQLAADSGALAGARVLANSGTTSNPADLVLASSAKAMAENVAKQVAASNKVGGRNLALSEVTATATGSGVVGGALGSNPRVVVTVTRSDLPTFFARIWGTTQITLGATSTAEAYNPSGLNVAAGAAPPVAPTCVKPWVLPNMDISSGGNPIFDVSSGAILSTTLLGYSEQTGILRSNCGTCGNPTGVAPRTWRFYPGDPISFPIPTSSLPTCNFSPTDYQKTIEGCVQTPIACHSTVNLDHATATNLHQQAAQAVNCMTHAVNDGGDSVQGYPAVPSGQPFQFSAGSDNPIVAAGTQIFVSDSLVTVPVYNSAGVNQAVNPVTIIGFVQLFLNPDGNAANPAIFPPGIKTTVVNLVGCGTNASGTPVFGNGASPVAVRLITGGN